MYCLSCVVLCIVCVYMCTERLPPGGYPIAVNKYTISYQKYEGIEFSGQDPAICKIGVDHKYLNK